MRDDMNPVSPRPVEKLTLTDGRILYLECPRLAKFTGEPCVVGYEILVDGTHLNRQTSVPEGCIDTRVPVGWSRAKVEFVEYLP